MSDRNRRNRILAVFTAFFLIAVAAYGVLLAQSRVAYNESFTHQMVSFEIGNNYAKASAPFDDVPPYAISVGYRSNKMGIGQFYRTAWARWHLNLYPLVSFARQNTGAKAFLVIESDIPHADVSSASVSFALNGRTVRTLQLSHRLGNEYRSTDADQARDLQLVHYTSADARTAWAFPIPLDLVQSTVRPDIEVRTAGLAGIDVRSVGIMLEYTPALSPVFTNPSTTLLAGIAVLLLLSLAVAFVADRIFRIGGWPALTAMLLLFALALLNQDQWDFPIWRRLSELVTFGHANPALDWNLSPFWAFVPSIVSPIVAAIALYAHAVGPGITGVFLKILFAVAYVYGAVTIAGFAEDRKRTLYTVLISIFGAYLLMWGARDIIAVAIALAAFALALRAHLWPAQILFLLAGSVDEYLLPLMIVPVLAEFASGRGPLPARLAKSAGLALTGFGGFAAQWLLVSRAHFSESVAFRLHYHYLEATWQHVVLQTFGESNPLSNLLLVHKTLVMIAIYLPFAIALVARNFGRLFARCESAAKYLQVNLPFFCALLGIFFLSYGQVDQQEWFGFIAIVALTSAVTRSRAMLQYFFIFSTVAGVELYAHFGLREFLNPNMLQSADFGLITIRSPIDTSLIMTAILLVLGYVVHVFSRSRVALTTPGTFYCFGAWVLAVWTSTDFLFGPDLWIAIAVSAALLFAYWFLFDEAPPQALVERFRFLTRSPALAIVLVAALVMWNPALPFVAALFVIALGNRRPGIVDGSLLFSAMWLAAQPRGAIGWVCLALFIAAFVATAVVAERPATSRIRPA